MDRHRGGDRPGEGAGGSSGNGGSVGSGGGGVRNARVSSRWSSGGEGSPTHANHRGRGAGGGGDGFSGSGGSGNGRFHPYRAPSDYPPVGGGGGLRGSGGRGPPHLDGPVRRGFSGGPAGSPDNARRSSFVKLFIGSVPRTATEDEIRPPFEDYGDVLEVALIRDRKTGEQQGCCFVKYATIEEAERAIRGLHNQYTLPGAPGPIQVRYADSERERQGTVEHKLFVASLNKQANIKEIEDIFAPYGQIEDVYLMRDQMKQSRGCGFVKFATREMALAALNALNGNYVMRGCDQPLVVRFAEPKRPRFSDPRGADPAFGGQGGFSPRSEAALVIRPTANLEDLRGPGHQDSWKPSSPRSGPPPFNNFKMDGSGNNTDAGSNQAMMNARAGLGQQMPPFQKQLLQQNFPQAQQIPTSNQLGQALQSSMQQQQHGQIPQPGGLSAFGQTIPPFQLPSLGGQLPMMQPGIQSNPSGGGLQVPLVGQPQGIPDLAGNQQLPGSNIAASFLQQPIQQMPQFLLQQQQAALNMGYPSSQQQTLLQLQQQLQLMQQNPNMVQQPGIQTSMQQPALTSVIVTSSTAGTAGVIPPGMSATPQQVLTCNWTEHTSPEGFMYYYNSITRESKWEKPEEYAVYEQQQKLLLLQQQKLAVEQLQTQGQLLSQMQGQPGQQQFQQGQLQMQQQLKPQQPPAQLIQRSVLDGSHNQLQPIAPLDPGRAQQVPQN